MNLIRKLKKIAIKKTTVFYQFKTKSGTAPTLSSNSLMQTKNANQKCYGQNTGFARNTSH